MSSAVSSIADVKSLTFFLCIIHLRQSLFIQRSLDAFCIHRKPVGTNLAQGGELIRVDILPLTLGEAVEKNRTVTGTIGHQHSVAARPSLSRPRHPLLDQTATKVRVDQAPLGTLNRLPQRGIGKAFAPRVSPNPFRFENPHTAP
jgi:hypothetical protein